MSAKKKGISDIFSSEVKVRELPVDKERQIAMIKPSEKKVWIVVDNQAFEIDLTGIKGYSVKTEDGKTVSVTLAEDREARTRI